MQPSENRNPQKTLCSSFICLCFRLDARSIFGMLVGEIVNGTGAGFPILGSQMRSSTGLRHWGPPSSAQPVVLKISFQMHQLGSFYLLQTQI